MKVWLLTVGEPLPIDPGPPRLLRCGILANILAEREIDVVWWADNFRHIQKDKRFDETTAVQINPYLKIWCLDSRPYRRNVSVTRILANYDIAAEFKRRSLEEAPPDVIFASYPIPELAKAGVDYAHKHSLPSIVDIRDLWPDIWTTVLPKPLRPLGSIALLPFHFQSARTLKAFSSICAITDEMAEWGLERAGRPRGKDDQAFPLAYTRNSYSEAEIAEARTFWTKLFEAMAPARLKLCFFGIMSHRLRIDVIIDAIRLLPDDLRRQTRVVLCGNGDGLDALRASAAEVPEIVFPGWVNGPQIEVLAQSSDAGMLPYPSDPDFRRSIPNKVIEYLAYGLPVLTSLRGPVSDLIADEKCGRIYRETDARDLSATIADLIESPEQLQTMSQNTERVFQERFHATKVYGRLADMLVQVAEAKNRS